ncbi:MAG: ATP-binding protein [Myxococcota bacterium]
MERLPQLRLDVRGDVTMANAGALALLGHEREALLGRPYEDLLADAGPELLAQAGQSGARGPWEFRLPAGQGTRALSGELLALRDATGQLLGYRWFLHDTTALRSAVRRAATAEQRLAETQRTSGVGSWSLDLATQEIWWSRQCFHVFGIHDWPAPPSFEQLLGWLDAESRPEFLAQVEACSTHGTPYSHEMPYDCDDGVRRMIEGRGRVIYDDEGNPLALHGTARDVTERHARAEQTRLLAEVAARTHSAVIITDAEGRTEWLNEAFTRHAGYDLAFMRGKVPGRVLQGPDTDPETVKTMAMALASREGFKVEVLNYTSDRKPYWVELEVRPLYDAAGKLRHFMAVQQDITERREVQAERARHLRDLQENHRRLEEQAAALVAARDDAMRASRVKSQFLANMSHEIRTPMNGVLGMLSLAEAAESRDELLDYIRTARGSAEALLTIINDILDLSKIEAEKMELERVPFVLREELAALRGMFEAGARQRGLDFAIEVGGDVPSAVVGDPVRLRQVLTNLVGNALKFTNEGGVSVDVTRAGDESGYQLRFAVRETGVGIPKDKHAHVFDAFTQADGSTTRKFGGTGLGLAICARLARMMGGELSLESEVGVGSCFAFDATLPEASAPERRRSQAPLADELPPLRILVAEDNEVNALVARKLLEKSGHTVQVAPNGLEAAETYARDGERIDVILMDMQMPVLDGLEATRRIREAERARGTLHVPIVALTANAMKGDDAKCLAAGMDAYVSKPLRLPELEAALRRVLAPRVAA